MTLVDKDESTTERKKRKRKRTMRKRKRGSLMIKGGMKKVLLTLLSIQYLTCAFSSLFFLLLCFLPPHRYLLPFPFLPFLLFLFLLLFLLLLPPLLLRILVSILRCTPSQQKPLLLLLLLLLHNTTSSALGSSHLLPPPPSLSFFDPPPSLVVTSLNCHRHSYHYPLHPHQSAGHLSDGFSAAVDKLDLDFLRFQWRPY